MPLKEVSKMSLKIEFIRLAMQDNVPFSELCSRFGISRKTGYKLLNRFKADGLSGLEEKSRAPLSSPLKTSPSVEEKILSLRKRKPSWGGRMIRSYLLNRGETNVPAHSTITDILHRHGYIHDEESIKRKKIKRFEHKTPNDLWQIDFKGHFQIRTGRCHPLTILDDHSRFSIGLRACSNERGDTVKQHFINVFEEYGLPWRINFDNGAPWGTIQRPDRYTALSLWLIRLGVHVSFSKIRRPQTNGKIERFHLTLKKELLQFNYFWNLKDAQKNFDRWRAEYNLERPHQALDMKPPITRYTASTRAYPQNLPMIEYRDTDLVRTVNAAGNISLQNRKIFIGEALKGQSIGIRKNIGDRDYSVYFCDQKIACIELMNK
jgi:transposase InsO family protein